MSWITEQTRLKHFFYAIPCAMLFTILFVGGTGRSAWSLKDRAYGGEKWNYLDLLATILSG